MLVLMYGFLVLHIIPLEPRIWLYLSFFGNQKVYKLPHAITITMMLMINITAAEAVDREFGYIETKGEDLRHRHHHRHHHHEHHPSMPKVSTEPPRVSPECPQRAPWTKENKADKSRFFSRKVEPHKFYSSKKEFANCPVFFQEGLMAEILFAEGRDGEKV